MSALDPRTRWLALVVLCLGDLMIVLDTTIVNVALPSIREDLGFTETSLAWVVNAYLLTFGGFLLLGGRLGDLFGHRRMFLGGVALFTLASAACGLATSQGMLVGARAVQGVGGAVVSAVALSLIMTLFTDVAERAKAMGVFGFVMAGGGSLGVMLGGILTDVLDWHWIFLVNLPIGIAVVVLALRLVPSSRGASADGRLDIVGAVTVTSALMLAVYAIVNGNDAGWTSARTLGLLGLAALLFGAFLALEARAASPLVPLRLFRLRNLATANVAGVLWAAAMFAAFFVTALYLQLVLGYSPLQVGLVFLPSNVIMAVFSLGLSARLVMRYGIRAPLSTGLLLAVFLGIEARVPAPLMPLRLFRLRNLSVANVVGVLWAAAMFAWFFLSALYLQLVLGYSPLQVGLAFLPANLIMGAFSLGLSARLVMRFGIRRPLEVGLLLAALGLALFARAPVGGSFVVDLLPSMILLGFGAGMAFNPVLLAAMSDVAPEESGLASGVVNTSFMMGGALGLAVLASLAASRTETLEAAGSDPVAALNGGYHVALLGGALFAVVAAVVAAVFLRAGEAAQTADDAHGMTAVTDSD